MSNIVSTWSPLDLVLPNVPADVDYAFYFVTDKGSYKNLNLTFNEGDWLVYLKKDGVGNWYKTNGIVTFNSGSSMNNPDPGYYTKVRLDNQGNIIAGEYLQEEDLPAHTHYLSDITDTDNIVKLIQQVVGEMVVNHDDSSVKLTYDKNTQSISAEVNYDGLTIDQNEFGELQAHGGDGGGSTNNTVTIPQVEDLTAKLSALESALLSNTIITNEDSGLESKQLEGGTILKVNVDGSSIRVNAYGQLEINPDFIITEDGEISSGNGCANHDHTADQIADLKDFVVNVINEYKTVNVTDLPIDGTTIVINNNGTLSAVSTSIAPHKHTMDDITDLNKAKADTWASDQPLQGSTTIDYTKGTIDLSNFTIGYSIEKLSEAIKEINTRIEYTESMVGKVVPNEPPKADTAKLSINYINATSVKDIHTQEILTAGSSAIITSTPIYPYNRGMLTVYIDDIPTATMTLNGSVNKGSSSDGITISDIVDSYPDVISFQGFYKSGIFTYKLPENIEEGYHSIKFVSTLSEGSYETSVVKANIYSPITPSVNITELYNVEPNKWVSGVHVYNGDGTVKGKAVIDNLYNKSFMPVKAIALDTNNGPIILDVDILDNKMGEVSFNFVVSEEDIDKNYKLNAYKFSGDVSSTATIHIPHVIFDHTEIDEDMYRFSPIIPNLDSFLEIPQSFDGFEEYNSKNKVVPTEMVIRNNIGRFDATNYTKVGNGPDYTNNYLSENKVWINFIFKSKYRNNIYMDVLDSSDSPFSKNKNGTINDISIYVGQSESLTPEVWVNGNIPFDGCSSASGLNFAGLDLFRSNNIRRYITFGQRPSIKSGYIFVKIGIDANKDLNCKVLVDSILESLNE